MNEWLKKMAEKLKDFWKNSSVVKKVILFSVIAVILIAIVVTAKVSARPSTVRLFNASVTNENTRSQILDRLSELNISASIDDNGYINIDRNADKKKVVSILMSEGLTPSTWDPFEEYYNRSWSATDAEQNVRLKNAVTERLQQQLEVLDDINTAFVTINIPKTELFTADQNPVSAGIVLKLSPRSDLSTNKKKQKNLERLVLNLVEGLKPENLTISDTENNVLNDFTGLEDANRLTNVQLEQKIRHQEEAKLKANILNHLQEIVKPKRIGDLVVNCEMDMSQESSEDTIYTPIQRKADNPNTPYDESEYVDTVPISEQKVEKEWKGTGYNPEGPAGVEGNNPPTYSDMSNVIGSTKEVGTTRNNVINTSHVKKTRSPVIGKTSVSVNIDGVWTIAKDSKTHAYLIDEETGHLVWNYTPVTENDLSDFTKLVRAAINYDASRGDIVSVTNVQVDRSEEHQAFEDDYFKKIRTRNTVLLALAAVAVVLVGFILFRIISKEIERRKRLREEELLRQAQAAREQALWDAKEDANMQVTMSVEESRRAELQENAINMAKEHPEDVAMLIRTWLMEE